MIKNTIAMMLAIVLSGSTIVRATTNNTDAGEYALRTINTASTNIATTSLQTNSQKLIDLTTTMHIALEQERQRVEELIAIKQAEIDSVIAENSRKNNATFNAYDVTQVTGLTANELYQTLSGFKNGVLAKFAWVLKDCEDIYGINAFFLAALIAQESGWVTSDRALYQNNLTGHAVYNNAAAGTTFNSQEESIYNTAKLLRNNYLTQGGSNYHGTSIWNVNTDYCLTQDSSSTDYNWSSNISSIANDFNRYYHNNIKTLIDVPVMDINMDEMLNAKRQEILEAAF